MPASLNYIGRMAFGMIQTIQYIRCDAVTPPELGDVVFYWTDTNTCVLEVPDESVEAYKAAAQWGDFINTTGVAKVLRDENSIIVESGNILNADNANIEVYTISGAKIYSGKDSRVTLPSGLYIIKSDDKAMKDVHELLKSVN